MKKSWKKIPGLQKDQVKNNFLMKRINKQKRDQTKHQHSVENPYRGHDRETKTKLHKSTINQPFSYKREGSEAKTRGETHQSEKTTNSPLK